MRGLKILFIIFMLLISIIIAEYAALYTAMKMFPNTSLERLTIWVAVLFSYPIYRYIAFVSKKIF